MPFRQAHEITGKVLRAAERSGQPWTETPLKQLREFSPAFDEDFYAALSVESSLAAHAGLWEARAPKPCELQFGTGARNLLR